MTNEIRKYYGLSQELLATYLGISRSLLSMVERGERDLKSDKMLKLKRLFEGMHNSESGSQIELAKELAREQKKINEELKFRKIECSKQLRNLTEKLKNMKIDQSHALSLLNSIENLMKGSSKRELIILDVLKDNARRVLSDSSDAAIMEVELELARVKGENDYLEKRKKNMD